MFREGLYKGHLALNLQCKSAVFQVSDYSNVTDNLLAISRQLADTVERSKQTVGSLEGTSKTVEELGDEYRMMGGVIGQSRKLITKYARREFTDKVRYSSMLKLQLH